MIERDWDYIKYQKGDLGNIFRLKKVVEIIQHRVLSQKLWEAKSKQTKNTEHKSEPSNNKPWKEDFIARTHLFVIGTGLTWVQWLNNDDKKP